MGRIGWKCWPALLLALAGCEEPALDLPPKPSEALAVSVQPARGDSDWPPLFRARLAGAAKAGKPWLLQGELSSYYQAALRRGEVPQALVERAVPLRYWHEASDGVLQPLSRLVAGEGYTLALEGTGVVRYARAGEADAPGATRFFPRAGRPQLTFGVWCGPSALGAARVDSLAPGALPLGVSQQAWPGWAGSCVALEAPPELDHPAVPPLALAGVPLEPAVFQPAALEAAPAEACPQQALAGACLELQDDRLLLTALGEDALWHLTEPVSLALALVAGQRALLLDALEPSSSVSLRGEVVSLRGARTSLDVTLVTAPPRRHLVLNEVLANAAGSEPESEWIELVNTAARAVSLANLRLEDSGGSVALPEVELAAGEFALLVGPGFRVAGLDVPVPEGVRRLTLESLGTRGLSNSGEALLLVGPEGVLSRFPVLPAPHPGRSLARRSLLAADDLASGFGEHAAPGASPGTANQFDD